MEDVEEGCKFTWNVSRTGCANNPPHTFTGSKILTCESRETQSFECGSDCTGLELRMTCAQENTRAA